METTLDERNDPRPPAGPKPLRRGEGPGFNPAGLCANCPFAAHGSGVSHGGTASAVSSNSASPLLRVGNLTLHTKRREATRAGQPIKALSPRESDALELFMRNPGQVFSRERILKEAWGFEFDPGGNIVEKNINRLRAKLNDGFDTDLIENVRGEGYRLTAAR